MIKLTYNQIIEVTQNPVFLILIIFVWFSFLGLYLILAGFTRARTSDGRKMKKSMLSHGNALIPIIVWVIQGVLLFFLIIFPVWAKLFE